VLFVRPLISPRLMNWDAENTVALSDT